MHLGLGLEWTQVSSVAVLVFLIFLEEPDFIEEHFLIVTQRIFQILVSFIVVNVRFEDVLSYWIGGIGFKFGVSNCVENRVLHAFLGGGTERRVELEHRLDQVDEFGVRLREMVS